MSDAGQQSASSPVPLRQEAAPQGNSRRVVEDEPRRQDKSYRRYASGIERALASFDTGRLEWPDYISFLGRLLKAIQGHPPAVEALPHKFNVANRLAQCLSPSLPNGVHQKAIEVYAYIFSLVGKETLAKDLSVYLPGLTSVLSFASLTLRPSFLSLIETHILALGPYALRPALKALILGLLPGLEDETSEEFERTLRILDSLKEAVNIAAEPDKSNDQRIGDQHFWQCFFLAIISNSARRQGALAYMNKRLPKFKAMAELSGVTIGQFESEVRSEDLSPDAEAAVSPEPGLLIRCFAAGLSDDQVLLQRGFLDLLLSHLPLDSPVLISKIDSAGLDILMAAAVGVVTRRDMSLNRRLWAWLLGPVESQDDERGKGSSSLKSDEKSLPNNEISPHEAFFQRYGSTSLIRSLLDMFRSGSIATSDKVKPFRICLSLMDRPELGASVVSSVFPLAMETLYDYRRIATDEFEEILRSANSFFDGIEAGVIWGQLVSMITNALGSNSFSIELRFKTMHIVQFIISHFSLREEEMVTVHIPLACSLILVLTRAGGWSGSNPYPEQSNHLEELALSVLDRLLQILPEATHVNSSSKENGVKTPEFTGQAAQKIPDLIKRFYQTYRGNLELSVPPLSQAAAGVILINEAVELLTTGIQSGTSSPITDQRARILASILAKQRDSHSLDLDSIFEVVKTTIASSPNGSSPRAQLSFQTLSSLAQVLVRSLTTLRYDKNFPISASRFGALLARNFWEYCSPSFPKYHVEAVRCLWQIDDALLGERVAESSISRYLIEENRQDNDLSDALEPARRFAVIWTHTFQLDANQSRKLSSTWTRHGQSMHSTDSAQSLGLRDYQSRLHRPLLLLLDALVDMSSEIHYFLASWMQTLPSIRPLLTVLVSRLSKTRIIKHPEIYGKDWDTEQEAQYHHRDDSRESLYYLQHLSTLLRFFTKDMWISLSESSESTLGISDAENDQVTMVEHLAQLCLQIVIATSRPSICSDQALHESLQRMALSTLQQLLNSPTASLLQAMSVEETLIESLRSLLALKQQSPSAQTALLDAITAALRLKTSHPPPPPKTVPRSHVRVPSFDTAKNLPRISISMDSVEQKSTEQVLQVAPPAQLMKCVLEGIASPASVLTLESWIEFLVEILPLFENNVFQNLIPLVECFCNQIRLAFQQLNAMFKSPSAAAKIAPEPALMSLLNGLEYVLATAHERLMAADEIKSAVPKSPEPSTQGFFGNVVSGVFSSESQKGRGSMANTRLTVILCFQDAIRICLTIWTWSNPGLDSSLQDMASTASLAYISVRLRNKTRRILDRIFSSESLESLETLVATWSHSGNSLPVSLTSPVVQLLHVLEGSKPRVVMPSIFNAIYSRTNSLALDPSRTSTLTSDLTDDTLARFLVEYTTSLEDDAMEEIWADCMTFLKDVLSNPLPHHQILPQLLIFLVTLTEKVDKTNFGEQRRMRKELGDLFLRLLTATFTAKSSSGALQELVNSPADADKANSSVRVNKSGSRASDIMDALTSIAPRISTVLNDNDRLMSAVSNISTNIISPMIHSKSFPENLSQNYLSLLYQISRITIASKTWKRDIGDIFNSSKLISINHNLLEGGLLPLIRQWTISEKDRTTELCTRIASPTSGGMFGVGASAARLEADKRAQINLRRVALTVMATEEDYVVPHLGTLEDKLADLLSATTATSPSSATRAELYMVWQAIILRTSSTHLVSLWPVLDAELRRAISASVRQSHDYDTYNSTSLLQACKLLDILVLTAPDEFQMHEWLFITDTVEAVYRPAQWEPVGLVDEIAEELGSHAVAETPMIAGSTGTETSHYKQALLRVEGDITKMGKNEFVNKVLRPFFAQLSIHVYEATYSMRSPDLAACEQALLGDIFDERTLVG